ncbi:HNH endonuclease [Streptomyces phaeochromogenes]|uniref:HNH endonuclease n=1 Tax=Streptomyces phaeochromogenes TaxID=1923 RepID=UPI002E2C5ED7|nr:HNH endonuclease [Streptomyces phaeochromogenes]
MKKNLFENGSKVCPGCKEDKTRESYYTTKGKAASRCKTCVDATNKAWQEANPEKYKAAQKAWRTANEGHTFSLPTGYMSYVGFNHPVANPSGVTFHHRVVLFDKIGPGEHECYWGCGKTLSWDKKYPESLDALVVDHLNGIRDDNRPENLVASCASCNASVSRLSRKVIVDCSFEGCENPAGSNGLCRSHYMQQYLGKELTPLRKKVMALVDDNGRVCTECDEYKTYENFTKTSGGDRYRSKCRACLTALASKNRDERLAKGIPCSEDDCKKPALSKGLCVTHYSRNYQMNRAA